MCKAFSFQYPLRAYGLSNVSAPIAPSASPGRFQYPLRAYGLSNRTATGSITLAMDFQYPLRAYGLSNGWRAIAAALAKRFQYPLRAYGLSNAVTLNMLVEADSAFQYPLRAYGLSNRRTRDRLRPPVCLSVPSTGLWADQHVRREGRVVPIWPFSTLYGPMG